MKKLHLLLALASALTLTACDGQGEDMPVAESGAAKAPAATLAPTPEPTLEPPAYEQYKVLGLSFDGNVEDSSTTGIRASLSKEGTYVEGVNGQALTLDGSTYIDLGMDTALQPENLTFASWIKVDENLAGEHMITWFKPSGNYQGEGWYLSCLDNNTPLKLSVGKAAGQPMEMFVSGSRADFFPVGEWVHIVVTYDSAVHNCNIYRNGVAQDVQYINEAKEIHADETSHKYIGFNSPGYNGGFAKMSLDELSIYNEVLSSSDVIKLYTTYGAEFDGSQVVAADYDSLSISLKSIKNDISLPTQGAAGSTISWSSSDETYLHPNGKVTRPSAGENDVAITLTATLSYADYKQEKTFEICVEAEPAFSDLQDFTMGDVTLLDAYETNAFALEVDYLKSLDADRLLKGFCDMGGVESDAVLYGGWENSAIKGHTLGHYLTAVSQAYATSGDKELLEITEHVVEVLAQCQDAKTGYLAAIPESHYIQIEGGNTAGTWVPWYTMHKVLSGLIDTYELTGNKQALTVASFLGDWVYSRTSSWNQAKQATVLNVEYGGMNDCLYQLYSHTGSEKHLSAAHSFDEMDLFDALYKGEDVLNGLHANTTIPKIIGALNRYMVLGESEEYYLQVAENFWEIVVNNHTYITGGNSEWEHFGEANILDAERTNCNCETCNTYNMLKLTRELFKITGNSKYSAYYENTFINAILSSQNPRTGMTTYFQPMATGYFKVYSSETGHFWCCTGSGMENFSKLGDSIYYKDENSIYVTRFTSSEVRWEEKGLTLTQKTEIPRTDTATFTISTDCNEVSADIVLYVPDWTCSLPTISINGTETDADIVNNYIRLCGPWKDGDVITYTLPMEIIAHHLPDNANVVAFKYGPIVLSADLGTEDMATGSTGVNVTVPTLFTDISDVLAIPDGSMEDWVTNINDHLVSVEGTLEFSLKGTDRELTFSPHYMQHTSRYGIYFELADADTTVAEDESDKYVVIDSLPVANDQYEFSHSLDGNLTNTGTHKGLNYRDAAPGGYFSYEFTVEEDVTNYLFVKYFSGDAGRAFCISVDGEVLEDEVIENINPDDFYDWYYEIPAKLTNGKETITVTFEANGSHYAGGIFDKIGIAKEKN